MNRIVVALFLIPAIAGCVSDAETTGSNLKEELQNMASAAQVFTVNPDSMVVITGKEGTKIELLAGSLTKKDGSKPGTMVNIVLREVYSRSQMMFNGLTTTSDGKLLESGGMLYLNAMAGEDTLQLAKEIHIEMPNKFGVSDGQYFKGQSTDKGINWVAAVKDTVFTIKRIVTLSYGPDSIIVDTLAIVDGDTVLVNRSTKYEDVDQTLADTVAYFDEGGATDDIVPHVLMMQCSTLGWINCDRFYKIPNPTDLILTHHENKWVSAYLVYKNLSTIAQVFFDNQLAKTGPVPEGQPVTILAITSDGSGYKIFEKDIVLGKTSKVDMDFKPITLDKLKKRIKRLDK